MKKLFTLALLGLSATSLNAQITLNQSSFAAWTPGNDSIRRISGTINVATGANISSDITAATYAPVLVRSVAAGTNATYPSATYYTTFTDAIPSSTNGGISWITNQFRGITATGIHAYGEAFSRQAYVIVAAGNPLDSVVLPAQVIPYSSARTLLKLPATLGTAWTNNYKYSVNMNITLAMYGMNNAPASRVTTATESHNINGWGKLRVLRADSTPSSMMDVLIVKSRAEYLDSLMFMGMPAPAGMINGFGFTQGRIDANYYMNYYRAGDATPVLRVFYTDSTYTTMNGGEANMKRLDPSPTSIPGVSEASFSFYPNPVAAGSDLNIRLSETTPGNWTIQLTDAAGRVIQSAPLQFSGNKAQFNLGAAPAAGMHFLRLYKDGQSEGVKPVMIK